MTHTPLSSFDRTPLEIQNLLQALRTMERCEHGTPARFEARAPLSKAIRDVERDCEPFVFYRHITEKAKEVLALAMKDKDSQKAWSANERAKMIQAFERRQAEERAEFFRDLERSDAHQAELDRRFGQ